MNDGDRLKLIFIAIAGILVVRWLWHEHTWVIVLAVIILLAIVVVAVKVARSNNTPPQTKPKPTPKRKQRKQQRPSPVQQRNGKASVYPDNGKHRCSACDKVMYKSKKKAEAAVQMSVVNYGEYMRSYQDPKCGHWHLTSHLPR